MKILVLNGSPRKGNSVAAIKAFTEGASEKHEIEIVDTYHLKISPCMACEACACSKGCVAGDDSNTIIDKMVEADMILFASPVYWWGITAQLKLVIDKAYCRAALLKNKKIGVIIVGGSPVENEQYDLIRRQFVCIATYLGWELVFHKSYSASAADELMNHADAMAELKEEGKRVS